MKRASSYLVLPRSHSVVESEYTPDTPLLPPTDAHDLSKKLSAEEALVHLVKGLTGTGLLFARC